MYQEPIDIDLILMMDTTGSMSGNIASAKKDARRVIDEFSKDRDVNTLRVGFIAYRDHKDDYVTKNLSLTPEFARVERFITKLHAYGGGDAPEAIAVAMHDATALFGDLSGERGKILVWYCDAPPHGKKYNCGLKDEHPEGDPSGIDFETEVNRLKEMNVLIYAIPFGVMALKRCFKQHLNRWTNNQVYAPLKRSDSLAFTDHILHAAVTECILRREVGRCITRGMSHHEIETHVVGLGLPKRDIIVEGGGTVIRTEERRLTRDDVRKTTIVMESTRVYAGTRPRTVPVHAPPSALTMTIECTYPFTMLMGSFSLQPGQTLSIGRQHFPANIPRRDTISRDHFTVAPARERTVTVTDTSTNGTRVNGVKLTKNIPQEFQLPITITVASAVTLRIG